MKRFILKSLILTSSGIIIVLITLLVIRILKKNSSVWKVSDEIEIVFAGDSHIEQAVNDSMSSNVLTFAQSGDNYLYTYTKLNQLIRSNKHIKTIVMGIDKHNIDSTLFEWYTNENYLNYKFSKVFPYLDYEDLSLMIKLNGLNIIRNIPNLTSYKNTFYSKFDDFGSYVASDETLDSIKFKSSLKRDFIKSSIQLKYIDKIINLAQQHNILLVLLTTPVHKSQYLQRIEGKKTIEEIAKNKNLIYLDFSDFPLSNECFADEFHLNKKGSKLFTEVILTEIRLNHTF